MIETIRYDPQGIDPEKQFTLDDIPFEATRPVEPTPPPFRDLIAKDRSLRKKSFKFYVSDTVSGLGSMAAIQTMRMLPTVWVTQFALGISNFARKWHSERIFAERIRNNIRSLSDRAAMSDQIVDEMDRSWWRNTAQTYVEFALVDRIWPKGRVSISGKENLVASFGSGRKIVWVSVHLGNWEAMGLVMHSGLKLPVVSVYEPRANRYVNRIVYRTRKRTGIRILKGDRRTAIWYRRLAIGGGCVTGMFVDEVRKKQIHFPLFGREPALESNVANVIKLARDAEAILLPLYILRKQYGQFELKVLPHVELKKDEDKNVFLKKNINMLNDIFEPVIRDNLDQWFMLSELRLNPKRSM